MVTDFGTPTFKEQKEEVKQEIQDEAMAFDSEEVNEFKTKARISERDLTIITVPQIEELFAYLSHVVKNFYSKSGEDSKAGKNNLATYFNMPMQTRRSRTPTGSKTLNRT